MENNKLVYAYEIDDNGRIIESHFIDAETNQNDRMITIEIPRDIFIPIWNGYEWTEGKTQAEIEEDEYLNSLIPSAEEIEAAEFEIKILNILMEVELI